MKYIVDIDGTICISIGNDYSNSSPIVKRIEYLNNLYDDGHEIHYWTARGMKSGKNLQHLTKMQIEEWGVKHTSLKFDKPSYDIWIDDKAMSDEEFFDDIDFRT